MAPAAPAVKISLRRPSRKTLTNQEAVPRLACAGSSGEKSWKSRETLPRCKTTVGALEHLGLGFLDCLDFFYYFVFVCGGRGEQLVLSWSSGERLVSSPTHPGYTFTTDSHWQFWQRWCVCWGCVRLDGSSHVCAVSMQMCWSVCVRACAAGLPVFAPCWCFTVRACASLGSGRH